MDTLQKSITCHSEYSFEEYKELYKFNLFRSKSKKLLFISLPVLAVLLSLIGFLFEFDMELIILDVLLILLTVLIFVFPGFIAKIVYKKTSRLFGGGVFFRFGEDEFLVQQHNDSVKSETSLKYSTLYKVYETAVMFYLYINAVQVYMINKNNFESGNPDDLRALLLKTVDSKKYRRYH